MKISMEQRAHIEECTETTDIQHLIWVLILSDVRQHSWILGENSFCNIMFLEWHENNAALSMMSVLNYSIVSEPMTIYKLIWTCFSLISMTVHQNLFSEIMSYQSCLGISEEF